MFALLLIDHRLALLALAALLIAAAIPLAFAWTRLLPEEPPPFPIQPGSFPTIDQELPSQQPAARKRDLVISIVLLVCLTLAYVSGLPAFRVPSYFAGLTRSSLRLSNTGQSSPHALS